jgi:hypothetical protein
MGGEIRLLQAIGEVHVLLGIAQTPAEKKRGEEEE